MPEIKEGKLKSDGSPRLLVITPYHPEAVTAFRNLMGKWDSCNRWWVVLPEHRKKVEAIIEQIWPDDRYKVERIYRFTSEQTRYTAPVIDGLEVMKGTHVEHPNVVEVLDNKISCHGSRRSPTYQGTLVVRARVRPEADARWSGASVELLHSDDAADNILKQVFEATDESGS